MTAIRTWRRKYEEAVALLREREERLERTLRTVEHVAQSQVGERPRPSPPPEPDEQPPRGLSVAEQDAINRGLTGPPWWADREALDARREARRRARFIDC